MLSPRMEVLIVVFLLDDPAWKVLSHGAIGKDPFQNSKTNMTGLTA